MANMYRLWTIKRVAKAADLTPRHVNWLINQGRLKACKVAHAWLIDHNEVCRFLADRGIEIDECKDLK